MKFYKHKQHSTLLTSLTYHKHFEIEAKLTFFSGPILNSRTPNQLFRAGKKIAKICKASNIGHASRARSQNHALQTSKIII